MRTEYHLAFVMFLIICKISDAAICNGNGKSVCCSGYEMDKNGVCVECSPGYTGRDCVYMCQYPDYGKDCLMVCECTAEMCDHRSGCRYVSTTVNSSYPYKTTGPEKPKRPTTDAVTQNQKGSTQSGSASSVGLFSISTVVNITIVLISVFVFTFIIYGISYLRKVFVSRKNKKLDHQYTANNNSMYECVEFPHHI